MSAAGGAQAHDAGDASTIRRRGAAGAALLTARAAAAQAVAFAGTVALTHLLAPAALGVVAFGATIVSIGTFFSDGGIGAALIRGRDEPTGTELQTLLGFQLAVALGIAVAAGLIGLGTGRTGAVTAVMTCSLLLLAVRAPHAIALERALDYRAIASVEFVESLVQYAWAIPTVWVLGWGVWGLATAAIVRSAAGSVLMSKASPLPGLMRPRIVVGTLRSMLGFGLGVQAVGIAGVARAQGINLVIAAVGGERALGLWSLATRVLFVPFWLFQSLWRVSYPTMARLRSLGEDTTQTVQRLAEMTALASSAILAPLAASAHTLVPGVFGSNWAGAAAPVAWASAGLIVSGPVSVAASGYLFSEGDVRSPLAAATVGAAVFVALAAGLVGPLGISGAGIAWMLASLAEALVFAHALRRRAHVAVERFLWVSVVIAAVSALGGWAVPQPFSVPLAEGLLTAFVTLLLYAGLSFVFNRDVVVASARRLRALR
jgi:PST family polysaccharide transporter